MPVKAEFVWSEESRMWESKLHAQGTPLYMYNMEGKEGNSS